MTSAAIQNLFAYNEWANELVLDAVTALPDEQLRQDFKVSHGSIHGTLMHTAAAEWLWLKRWQGRSPRRAEWEHWQAEYGGTLATLRQAWHQVAGECRSFLAGLDEAQLASDWPFQLANGTADALPLAGQMQHVVNHSTLHRGQIVGMLRQLGVVPPATDLLFYLREKKLR